VVRITVVEATLERVVGRLVDEVVAERRPELEALVASRVDLALDRLVRAAIDVRLNGHAGDVVTELEERDEPASAGTGETPVRVCSDCGQAPAVKWRSRCGRCQKRRERSARERRQAAEGADSPDEGEARPPAANGRTATGALPAIDPVELLARIGGTRGTPGFGAGSLAGWLVGAGFASVDEDGRVSPTELAVEVGSSIAPL
jgi:hypothetical protein